MSTGRERQGIALGTLVRSDPGAAARRGWLRTVWRLACLPHRHPWEEGGRRRWWLAPAGVLMALVVLGVALLLQGCAHGSRGGTDTAPEPAPAPPSEQVARGRLQDPGPALCQTLSVPLRLQTEGDPKRWLLEVEAPQALGEADVTVHPMPPAGIAGARARLLGQVDRTAPRPLSEPMAWPPFPGPSTPRRLRLELLPPEGPERGWFPRACRQGCGLRVEVQAPFGAGPMLADFLRAAQRDLERLEAALRDQDPGALPQPEVLALQEGFEVALRAGSCRSPGFAEALQTVARLVQGLGQVHTAFYGGPAPQAFDVADLQADWARAAAAVDPLAGAVQGAPSWPPWERFPALAAHVSGMRELRSALPADQQDRGAYWLAVALVTRLDALERLRPAAPPLSSLQDARQRRSFLLGLTQRRPEWLTVPGTRWLVPTRRSAGFPSTLSEERLCFGPEGLLPAPAGEHTRAQLLGWLAADVDGAGLVIRTPADVAPALRRLTDARELLCTSLPVDVSPLRRWLAEHKGMLGALSAALQELVRALDYRNETTARHPLGATLGEAAQEALCAGLNSRGMRRRVRSVADYAAFIHGGAGVLAFAPQLPLRCGKQTRSAAEVREELRDLWGAAVHRASSPQALRQELRERFSLHAPHFARPVTDPDSLELEDPPPVVLHHRGCDAVWSRSLDEPALRQEARQVPSELQLPPEGGGPARRVTPEPLALPALGRMTGLRLTCLKGHSAKVRFVVGPSAGPLLYVRSPMAHRLAGKPARRRGDDLYLSNAWISAYDLRRHPAGGGEVILTLQPTANDQAFLVTTVAASAR